jgi:NitT/TauT family transport system substrate-binding protein
MFRSLNRGLAAALVVAGVFLFAEQAAAQAKMAKVKGGVSVSFEGMLAVWVADDRGYFKAENIEVEFIDFKGGGPTVQAFAGGAIDICFCATDHALRLKNRGRPTVVLYGLDRFHDYTLIGKAGVPTTIEGLKGKKVGVSSPGSMTDSTIRWAIKELKMEPDRDYQIVGSGTGAAMIAAIDGGRVDAGLVVETDTNYLLQKKGVYTVVKDFSTMPYASFSVLALESWVSANPEVARGFARAVAKAAAELEKNPTVGAARIKKMYPHFSDELVLQTVKSSVNRLPKNGAYEADAVRNMNAIVIGADPALKPISVDELKPRF